MKSDHPLAGFVFKLADENQMIDVTNVAMALSGNAIFIGRNGKKCRNAYRVVAADVLGFMTSEGILDQHGEGKISEEGGPHFTMTWF